MKRVVHPTALVAIALVGAALVGCSSAAAPSAAPLPRAVGSQQLAGACPDTVSIQQDWEPEAEAGALYQLVGPGYTVDAEHKRIRGPLVIDGKDTGVKIELRAGGAAIGFAAIPAQMYVDKSITLGAIPTDRAISTSADQPVVAVASLLTKAPYMLMWDPASHPTWHGIADIGASNATVVVEEGISYPQMLVSKGLLKPSQIDTSYAGSPARFVSDPTIVQQGYATAEPYMYSNEVTSWHKPVRYQLLADVGYNIYPGALSVRLRDLEPLAACLSKLVPILQHAQLDYLANPGPTNQLITEAVAKYNDGWSYSLGVANYGAATMKSLGIVANDSSGPLGGMDAARVQSTIDVFSPILARSGAAVRPGLKAADIATNRFVDPIIRLN